MYTVTKYLPYPVAYLCYDIIINANSAGLFAFYDIINIH